MNILSGNILEVKYNGHICLVSIKVGDDLLTSLVIEDPTNTTGQLIEGNKVNLHFKETEIILAKTRDLPISLSNSLHCTIDKIERDEILSKIQLDYSGRKLQAIVTSAEVLKLELNEKDTIFVFVKNNEIMLSY